eukprot:gene4849-5203_t
MKGTKVFPQCGFSNTAVRILEALSVPFESVNVLEDETIRNGIKIYSSWPTIPQLYVNKEFIGGSDIMIQMYNSGELAELIEVTRAK